jgi:hypothetical protein
MREIVHTQSLSDICLNLEKILAGVVSVSDKCCLISLCGLSLAFSVGEARNAAFSTADEVFQTTVEMILSLLRII